MAPRVVESVNAGWIERSYAREEHWQQTKKQVMTVC